MPKRRTTSPLTFADVRALAAGLPGVEEGTSYGTPALKVKGHLIARLREDGESLVLRMPIVARDHLIAAEPDAFYLTDHYRGYPYVLVRLPRVAHARLAELLEDAWREEAPKRLVAQYDVARRDGSPSPAQAREPR